MSNQETSFNKKVHIKFLRHMLNVLPTPYSGQDSNRMTLMYFVVGGMEILDELQANDINKQNIIDFVYTMQAFPGKDGKNIQNSGFRGGTFFGNPYNPACEIPEGLHVHDQSHIAMTYTALAILLMCGDDLSKVQKGPIVSALKHLQRSDGSFCPVSGGSENDMRFVYCAAAISYMLNDFSGMDVDKAVNYILSSQAYDYGIAQAPGQESHGGSTYCAVAALALMGRLDELKNKDKLIHWCVERHISGFQGRINKVADSCYSFWLGATLDILGAYHLIDFNSVKGHTLSCEQKTGGIAKWPDQYADVLHTYMSLAGLSLGNEPGIQKIDSKLGFSLAAVERLHGIHLNWKK